VHVANLPEFFVLKRPTNFESVSQHAMSFSANEASGVSRFASATLCFNVSVVLWGAFVRAMGSGALWQQVGGATASSVGEQRSLRTYACEMPDVEAAAWRAIAVDSVFNKVAR